jgi:hypothetical protein
MHGKRQPLLTDKDWFWPPRPRELPKVERDVDIAKLVWTYLDGVVALDLDKDPGRQGSASDQNRMRAIPLPYTIALSDRENLHVQARHRQVETVRRSMIC